MWHFGEGSSFTWRLVFHTVFWSLCFWLLSLVAQFVPRNLIDGFLKTVKVWTVSSLSFFLWEIWLKPHRFWRLNESKQILQILAQNEYSVNASWQWKTKGKWASLKFRFLIHKTGLASHSHVQLGFKKMKHFKCLFSTKILVSFSFPQRKIGEVASTWIGSFLLCGLASSCSISENMARPEGGLCSFLKLFAKDPAN